MKPTSCSRTGFKDFVKTLLKSDKSGRQELQLDLEAKELFESIALRRGFAGDARCVSFMKSLFTEGLQEIVFCKGAHS